MSDLDPDLRDLFDAERARPGMPAAARERVLSRLAPVVGAAPAPDPAPAPSIPTSTLLTVTAFGAGILAGVAGYAGLSSPAPAALRDGMAPPAVVLVVHTTTREVVPDAAEAPVAEDAPSAPVAEAASATASARAPSGRDTDLAAERAVLEVARTALARGDHDAALAALAGYTRKFPQGRLREERDSLQVHALAAAGRKDEARAEADRFRARTPDSMLLPGVEEAVR
jgi:hypothetical protein